MTLAPLIVTPLRLLEKLLLARSRAAPVAESVPPAIVPPVKKMEPVVSSRARAVLLSVPPIVIVPPVFVNVPRSARVNVPVRLMTPPVAAISVPALVNEDILIVFAPPVLLATNLPSLRKRLPAPCAEMVSVEFTVVGSN